MKKQSESKRNKVAQVITLKDGSKKTIFHEKKFALGSRKQFWNSMNTSAKPNSKRSQAKIFLNTEKANSGQSDPANSGNAM